MEIEEMLKQKDLKVTPQRKAILAVLKNTHSFISAQGLFQEVIKILPGTNFSTVYRNLDVLLSKGLLCRVPSDTGADLYELRYRQPFVLTNMTWPRRKAGKLRLIVMSRALP